MQSHDLQLRRVALIATLVVLLVGGALIGIPAMFSLAASPSPQQTTGRAPASVTAEAPAEGAPPLPTIAQLTADTSASPIANAATAVESAASTVPTVGTPQDAGGSSDADGTDLAARLAAQLACIQPGTRHDVALDLPAAALAQQETASPPAAGTIQIHGSQSQQLLLAADVVAELRAEGGRCGETLVFGVPPLEWLPKGTHFGVGVAMRDNGALATILMHSR
jgi:hypothetical protein